MGRSPGRIPPTRYCRIQLVKKLVAAHQITSFIDVGCGEGHASVELGKMGLRGDAFDLSPAAVEQTRKRLADSSVTSVTVHEGDLFAADNSLSADAVVILEVLEHLEDDVDALARIRDLVKSDGYLIFSVPAHEKHWDVHDDRAGHVRRYEKEQIRERLRVTGWRELALFNYGFPFLNILKIPRRFASRDWNKGVTSVQGRTEGSGVGGYPRGSVLDRVYQAYGVMADVAGRPFLSTDLGQLYVGLARKQEHGTSG